MARPVCVCVAFCADPGLAQRSGLPVVHLHGSLTPVSGTARRAGNVPGGCSCRLGLRFRGRLAVEVSVRGGPWPNGSVPSPVPGRPRCWCWGVCSPPAGLLPPL